MTDKKLAELILQIVKDTKPKYLVEQVTLAISNYSKQERNKVLDEVDEKVIGEDIPEGTPKKVRT